MASTRLIVRGIWGQSLRLLVFAGRNWSAPTIVLEPSTVWDHSSVCDPSLVKYRGTYFLYHTCINTCTYSVSSIVMYIFCPIIT